MNKRKIKCKIKIDCHIKAIFDLACVQALVKDGDSFFAELRYVKDADGNVCERAYPGQWLCLTDDDTWLCFGEKDFQT